MRWVTDTDFVCTVDDLKQRILKFDLHPGLIEAIVNTLHMVSCCSFYILLCFLENKSSV